MLDEKPGGEARRKRHVTMSETAKVRFKDHTSLTLLEALAPLGVDARLARRLQAAVMRKVGVVPERMPEVPRRVLDGAGHLSNLERPDAFDEAVLAFVASF